MRSGFRGAEIGGRFPVRPRVNIRRASLWYFSGGECGAVVIISRDNFAGGCLSHPHTAMDVSHVLDEYTAAR